MCIIGEGYEFICVFICSEKGLQLFGSVRTKIEDTTDTLLKSIQTTQNKFARYMNGTCIADRINTTTIHNERKLLSINQINAQFKLTEVWKSNNSPSYPIKWELKNDKGKNKGLCSTDKNLLNTNLWHVQT